MGFAGEVPDHRAELGHGREAEPVIDAPDPAVVTAEHVAALAVGVVGDEEEQGDPGQLGAGLRGVLEQGEVGLLEVALDKPLQRAEAQRRVLADHRRRDAAKGLAKKRFRLVWTLPFSRARPL